jgi:predicted aconitase with swiveling domain
MKIILSRDFGCIVNGIPMMADLDQDPFKVIATGDHVAVNADEGFLLITKQATAQP